MDGHLRPAGLMPSSRFEVRLERERAGVGSVEINKDHPKKNKQRLSTPSKAVSLRRLPLAETRRQVGVGSRTPSKEEGFG